MEIIEPWVTLSDSELDQDDLEKLSNKRALMFLLWFVILDHTSSCLLQGLIFVLWKVQIHPELIALGSPGSNVP